MQYSDPQKYQRVLRLILGKIGIDPSDAPALGLENTIVEIETLYRDGERKKRSYYLREIL